MQHFAETELILTADQRLYHIDLKGEEIADNVLLVGDPHRVDTISRHFSSIEKRSAHREFISHTGYYRNNRITVLSTGIGTDNIDIVLNELDAAVNIDPSTRRLKEKKRCLNLYRLGTSGALIEDLPVNSLVCSSYGMGLDGLLNYYKGWENISEKEISAAFIKHTNWLETLAYPYCIAADQDLLSTIGNGMASGITATAPGFYGPQGRRLRAIPAIGDLNEMLGTFSANGFRITNFEMETSALYGLGKLLGHRCLTVCVIIANRVTREFTKNYAASVDLMIERCLHKITEQNT